MSRRRRQGGLGLLTLVLAAGAVLFVANVVRQAFAHGLHAFTGGATTPDRVVGIVLGLAPLVLGVVAFWSRRRRTHEVDPSTLRPSERRALRRQARRDQQPKPLAKRYSYPLMASVGLLWLLSPATGLHTHDESAQAAFERLIPGYVSGLLIGGGITCAAVLVFFAILRLQARGR